MRTIVWAIVARNPDGSLPVTSVLQSSPLPDGTVLCECDLDDAQVREIRKQGVFEVPLEAEVGSLSPSRKNKLKQLLPNVQDTDRGLQALRKLRDATGVGPEFLRIEHRS